MKWNSKAQSIVEEAIERERAYLNKCEEASDEYNKSQKRLIELGQLLEELEKTKIDSKDRYLKFVLEVAKIVTNVVVPVGLAIFVVLQEREITLTGAARQLVNSILPGGKKLF